MSRISGILRPLLRRQLQFLRPISTGSTPLMSTLLSPSSLLSPSYMSFSSLSIPAVACLFSPSSASSPSRCFSSSSESPSNMVQVKSENQLSESLRKATDDSFPSIFYFTAEWCGPCRFLWPDIKKLSESLPDVTFYKIDIDEVGTGPTVHKFCISSVPTLHFFKDGKKAAEVVGADSRKIKDITSTLYKNNPAE
ncbi:thioredoxin O2, mitochondrial-like [Silene latifolia]|uniref:thioredoxin O2, mitochondrial-like n=1 Tax=Silene latifolia TaxID=37657 RepID=UPI003D78728C